MVDDSALRYNLWTFSSFPLLKKWHKSAWCHLTISELCCDEGASWLRISVSPHISTNLRFGDVLFRIKESTSQIISVFLNSFNGTFITHICEAWCWSIHLQHWVIIIFDQFLWWSTFHGTSGFSVPPISGSPSAAILPPRVVPTRSHWSNDAMGDSQPQTYVFQRLQWAEKKPKLSGKLS